MMKVIRIYLNYVGVELEAKHVAEPAATERRHLAAGRASLIV